MTGRIFPRHGSIFAWRRWCGYVGKWGPYYGRTPEDVERKLHAAAAEKRARREAVREVEL